MNQRNTGFNIDEELSNCGNKIIHYCWFGGKPKPKVIQQYINSWKKNLPDYDIIEWNESNFDYKKFKYTREAYYSKKFAFVSDVCISVD